MHKSEYIDLVETTATKKPIIVFKFGAKWCKPCQSIDTKDLFASYNMTTTCVYEIDIDTSFELFAHLRMYKLISVIPTFLVYKDSRDYLKPDGILSGTDKTQLNNFFDKQLKS